MYIDVLLCIATTMHHSSLCNDYITINNKQDCW